MAESGTANKGTRQISPSDVHKRFGDVAAPRDCASAVAGKNGIRIRVAQTI